ncbi:MICAL-like protein 1 isoform X2 [Colletes gigas]|uniref:MICAL-like protein 1 isoform X2 n=1 Tax=Colletes gigas TaxID=935657 RepID=UPI001C9A997A|nr:MICAL-like protein 1 isoform X2 [Colletes gigas]
MGEKRGTKALELWCRRITAGYTGVNVQNMTTSWRDGLAFCAMIHHFRPDLIDFNSLDKNNVYGNNELAFKTAEKHLGIPALLDAEDMASCSVPDRLSILTYLSQFYQTFGGSSPSRVAVNRTMEAEGEIIVPTSESPKQKVPSRLGIRRDPCIACGLPVFLAEKLVVSHVTYHRTCFRCARCNNQLTLGNYYETEEGQFCCETCPDEDATSSATQKHNEAIKFSAESENNDIATDSSYQESFDDEEDVNRVFSFNSIKSLELDSTIPDLVAQTSRLRLNFISNHLLSEKDKETPVATSSLMDSDSTAFEKDPIRSETEATNSIDSTHPVNDKYDELNKREDEYNSSSAYLKSESQRGEDTIDEPSRDFMRTKDYVYDNVNSNVRKEGRVSTSTPVRAIVKNESVNLVARVNNTKELLGHSDEREDDDSRLSLVQRRLKLFESQDRIDHAGRRKNEHRSIEVSEPKTPNKQDINVINNGHKDPNDLQKTNVITSENNTVNNVAEGLSKWSQINSSKSNSITNEATDQETDQENSLSSSTRNLDAEKVIEDANTVDESKIPSSPLREMAQRSMTIHTSKENSEDKAFVPVAEETNQIRASNADLRINESYPKDLNPFKSDDEEEEDISKSQTSSSKGTRDLTNPFDTEDISDLEEDKMQNVTPPIPAARSNINGNKNKQQLLMEIQTKRRLIAPQINLNSFSSDEDERNSDLECQEERLKNMPVPKPRTVRHIQEVGTNERKLGLSRSSLSTSYGSLTSLESGVPVGTISRKKKPAPLPPNMKELSISNQRTPVAHQPHNNSSDQDSYLRPTPKVRKTKPAPPPPMQSSSPYNASISTTLNFEESPIIESRNMNKNQNASEDKKTNKDEANRSKQSLMHIPCGDNFDYKSYMDKSTQGKWKRKKGPAPPCPMPYKRKVKILSLEDVKLELDEIELQQQGLEKQGVRLEQLIRNKCESGLSTDDVFPGTDIEELVLELFALVNEKNELFRRQAELMLLRRQQRLEEEHVEVEYQIRCLMSHHESTKTDYDKQKEEVLIQRRNEIVECLEMDRRREIEEDKSIHKHMDLFAAKKKNETSNNGTDDPCCSKMKKSKIKKKTKEKKSNKMFKKDIDKDIDETELTAKRHNKRKWF